MTSYSPIYGPPADSTSVIGQRIGAWFIDLLIYVILVVAAVALSGTFQVDSIAVPGQTAGENFCSEWEETHKGACSYSDGQVTFVEIERSYVIGATLLNLVGYIIIQGITGGSLGKLAVGLRVVDDEGKKAGIGRSAIRTLLWVVDGVTCGFPVLGGVLMVSTKGHRRVGDMAAGTYVIDKHQVGQPVSIPGVTSAWPGTDGGYGQNPGWGQASGSWQPPASSQQPPAAQSGFATGPPAQAAPAAPAPNGDEPTWDVARNAYIQYDRDQAAWVQWDATSQQWRPIDQ